MMILICYGFVSLLTHFLLSRRCFKLTGKMPSELGSFASDYKNMTISSSDLFMFCLLWFLIPVVFLYHVCTPFTYYNKLVKMGLEEEEGGDLSRGAYR